MKKAILVSAILLMAAAGVQAAFIVEPHSSGKAFDHFTGTPRYSTGLSTAVGLTATSSAFGSTVVASDVYVFSYTPGVDLDNTTLTAGTNLGNGDLATGLTGGTGLYNVYITWCLSDNVTALANITVTINGADVVNLGVDMDNVKASETPPDTVVSKGMNAWLLIAQNVQLMAGTKYTVTQAATADTYTSLRSSGVMWERQVPEPMSLLLLGAGALSVRKFRKA
jgi:hypothetical protein